MFAFRNFAALVFSAALALTPLAAFAQAGLEFGPNGKIVEHVLSQGKQPVLSACGTSPALTAGSTDVAGKITVGTTASAACTLTFGTAWAVAPFCIVQNATTGAPANVYTVSTTAIAVSSVLADSTVLFYICIGSH